MSKIKNIVIILIMFLTMIIIIPESKAAVLTIAFSKSNVVVGETVNVTVNGNGITGKISLSVSGNAILSENIVRVNNSSATVKAKITGEGNIKITATPVDASDSTTAVAFTNPTAGIIKATTANDSNNSSKDSQKKSSDANLINLGITPNDFTGFKSGTTNYNVTVPNDIDTIEVYAKAQDAKAIVSGTGNKNLKEGENNLSVVVTAEDGTKKTYTINVTRESTRNTQTVKENKNDIKGLSKLKINDLNLNPTFETGIYEYTVKYIGEETKLNIETEPTEESYIVEITGNEDLKEGENLITIIVSDKEENNIATYQVNVNKSLVDEEAIAREQQEQKKKIIIGGAISLVLLGIIIFVIINHKKNKKYEEEYTVPCMDSYDNNDMVDDVLEEENVFDDEINISEEESKENLKEKYLSGFKNIGDLDDYSDFEQIEKRNKHRAKRFK